MGEVKLCRHKSRDEKYAVKIIKKAKKSAKDIEMQKREIEALKMCQHPNLIGFYDFFEDNNSFYMILEYLKGGDLFDYLERRDFIVSEERARGLALQLAGATYYLHTYGIVHRDLKLENVMMTDDSTDSVAKLVDFGLSAIVGP